MTVMVKSKLEVGQLVVGAVVASVPDVVEEGTLVHVGGAQQLDWLL